MAAVWVGWVGPVAVRGAVVFREDPRKNKATNVVNFWSDRITWLIRDYDKKKKKS